MQLVGSNPKVGGSVDRAPDICLGDPTGPGFKSPCNHFFVSTESFNYSGGHIVSRIM